MVELRSMLPLVKWSDQERRPSAGRCTQSFPVGLWTKGLKPSVATTVAEFLGTPHANCYRIVGASVIEFNCKMSIEVIRSTSCNTAAITATGQSN